MDNFNQTQEAIRMSLYQFLGGLLQLCPDRESAIATILEELTKISRLKPEDDNSTFHTDMIKPVLRSAVYILTIRFNTLLNDTINAFGEDKQFWPDPVRNTIDNDRQLIEMFNKYIDQL